MAVSAEGFAFVKPGDITTRKFLGGGGFGGVSLASHKHWGDVAVKEFNKITVNDEILKEAKKMWRVISCPYLVSIMGIIDDPGNPLSIVMEYLEYGDLMKFNRNFMMGCNCWARKIKMIQEISLGMNFLHTQNPPVIHRDLKLENVFVGSGFRVKIGDLGLALSTKTVQDMYEVSVAGTFSHIPPEGWDKTTQKPNKFWDIFTFAITLFELLCGEDPWLEHASPVLVSVWLQTGKRPDLERIPSDTPTEITALMERCWHVTPEQRPTFQEIQEEVSNVYRSQFEASLRKADRTINDRIDAVSDVCNLPTADSGVGSNFWESFGAINVKDKATPDSTSNVVNKPTTQKDSGIGISTCSQQNPTDAHNMREWRLVGEFGKEGDGEGEFKSATGTAVCQNGDIAVVDTRMGGKRVYYFSEDGIYKSTLKSHTTHPKGKLLYPFDVAVTSNGHLVVADQTQYVKVFGGIASFQRSLCTLTPIEDPNTKVSTRSVAVSSKDDIVVGDYDRKLVTIHSLADDRAPRKVKLSIKPDYLATNSQGHILVSDGAERKVIALSNHGDVLVTMEGFSVDGKAGKPFGLVCYHGYSNDDLYIAVMVADERNQGVPGTGHIHQYHETGRFLRCIAKGLYSPRGMTMYNGSLYVANKKSVLIYRTQ